MSTFKIDPKIDFKGIGFPLFGILGEKCSTLFFHTHSAKALIHVPFIEVMCLRPLYYNHPNLNGCPQVKAVGHIHFINAP
jgi:hypothetical protein